MNACHAAAMRCCKPSWPQSPLRFFHLRRRKEQRRSWARQSRCATKLVPMRAADGARVGQTVGVVTIDRAAQRRVARKIDVHRRLVGRQRRHPVISDDCSWPETAALRSGDTRCSGR